MYVSARTRALTYKVHYVFTKQWTSTLNGVEKVVVVAAFTIGISIFAPNKIEKIVAKKGRH